jgi:pyruvate,water dikinase
VENISRYILSFKETSKTKFGLTGGKGGNLGELFRIPGIKVPGGFCVTTRAYKKAIGANKELDSLLNELAQLKAEERGKIKDVSAGIRKIIESMPIPGDIEKEIVDHLKAPGENKPFAIRSSATAEDLPSASFAGQQDTYLNIIGERSILTHISKCWASLFTERAITYRIQNGFGHRKVQLAVVVQSMVFPSVSGILFTADPLTGNRRISSIDAGFGLGEALVSGLVNADNYKVCDGRITDKKIAAKTLAIYPAETGGTKKQDIAYGKQNVQALTDEQIVQLEQIGRRIEKHFGCPQDIEWCLAEGAFYIVQSRPVTTLYPVPAANDEEKHVYVSVGHQQMMTDAMKPLGLSLWQLTAFRPMFKAGGRLFVDIAANLATPGGAKAMIEAMGQHDPLIKEALIIITEQRDFIKPAPGNKEELQPIKSSKGKSAAEILAQVENDPVIISELIGQSQASIKKLKQDVRVKSGSGAFDFVVDAIQQLRKTMLDPRSRAAIVAAMDASVWLNDNMLAWLGKKNVADTLSQSVPNNVTSEMGLDLLDVADVIRPYPELIAYLRDIKNERFMEGMGKFNGGKEARDAINHYLDKYGMRCAGEIDITRLRWSERPSALVPMILNNIKHFEPGAAKRRFEQGRQEALRLEEELLERLKQLPGGEQKAIETKQMIGLLRNFAGYREYPKYSIISHYFVCKQALMKEAAQLAKAGIIREEEDVHYLTFEEFRGVVQTRKLNTKLISRRKAEHKLFEKLTPPRVITSDGEIITGKYDHEDLPAGAVTGLAVSSGIIEGRARVILNMEDARLEDGDILVTTFTDPGWTPLFVSIKGLVTEVGGLMTHGAVIAREYGLPAVVGVENATKLIKDGQRIRVNGTDGYVEVL